MESYLNVLGLTEIKDKPEDFSILQNRYQQLSNNGRKQVLKLIRENYLEVRKFKAAKGLEVKRLKRHFDFILSIESKAFEFFSERLSRNSLHWQSILQTYLKRQAAQAGLPQAMTVDNLYYVALKMQETIQSQSGSDENFVVLYGSAVNGRWVSKWSDLDYAVNDPLLLAKIEEQSLRFDELESFEISRSEGHRMSPKDVHSFGFLNPITIHVHARYIELRVYQRTDSSDREKEPRFYSHYIN